MRQLKENESYLRYESETEFTIINEDGATTYYISGDYWFENVLENRKETIFTDSTGLKRERIYNEDGKQIRFIQSKNGKIKKDIKY